MATQDSSPSLIIGQQWSALADFMSSNTENDEEETDKDGNKNSSDSMKLGRHDMGLFGFCPARDEFSLVVCESCNLLVKPQALKQHIESRHGPTNLSSLGNIPASALNSELGKKLLMPLPTKTPPPPPTSKSISRTSSGTFKPVASRQPAKASLKQVSANVKNVAAPLLGVSMKISPIKSVKSGNRVTPTPAAAPGLSNPVVKVQKLEKLKVGSSQEMNSQAMVGTVGAAPIKDPSKISTLINGSIKQAISLSTPSSLPSASPSCVSTPTCIAVTKSWTDTHLSTRSVTTFVTTTSGTKPLMIAPVMTIGSAGTPLPISSTKTSRVAKEKKFLPCKDREYDANKHCGVKITETGKPCTRSLTCKTHALSLRRAVPGRSKSFDDLLKEHKAAKDALLKAKAESQNAAAAASAAASADRFLVNSASINTTLNTLKQTSPVIIQRDSKMSQIAGITVSAPRTLVPSAGLPATTTFAKTKNIPNVFQRFTSTALLPSVITVKEETLIKQEAPSKISLVSTAGEPPAKSAIHDKKPDQSFLSHHPKPLAVCQFGGRLNDRGCFLFCRKMDYVRAAFLSALERQLNPPPHKKLCVESNLPRDAQATSGTLDPYEFNMTDGSGVPVNKNSSLLSVVKPNTKPKSNISPSPLAASSNPLSFTAVSLSAITLPSSLAVSATPIVVSSATPSSLSLNWSVKSKDSLNSRSPSASPLPSMSSTAIINPGKRKRSGSNGNSAGQIVAMATGNGTLPVAPAASLAMSTAGLAVSQQSGLAGLITPTTLTSHQASNLIAFSNVNLNSAFLGQMSTTALNAAKLNTGGSAHKGNNMFKDINLVLTGVDSVNGQVVNITSAQLAELTNQGQTIYFNNNLTSVTSAASGTTGSASASANKRNRASKSQPSANKLVSSKIPCLESLKLIPRNSIFTSGSLQNAVLMDSGGGLQTAVLTSMALASGVSTPTLVAIASSSANSNTVPGSTSQILCLDSTSGQLANTTLVNGLAQSYDKSVGGAQRHHASSKSHHHHQQQQLGGKTPQQQTLAIGNVLQSSSTIAMPLPSGSGPQLCANQALLKQGFKGGMSLTFPISVSQTGLALAAAKPQQQHTLLVATSGGAVGDVEAAAVRVASKTDVHLSSQISSSPAGNLIS